MKTSIIIPIFKEEPINLRNLYCSLIELNKTNIEIIIVHTSETVLINPLEIANILIINLNSSNTSHSINQGISIAKGEYIIVCGARSFINQSYIDTCVALLEHNPTWGCAGGRIDHVAKTMKGKAIAKAMEAPLGMGVKSFRSKRSSGFVDTVSVPVFPKNVFNKVGLFDEHFIRNQDDDMSYRIHKAGLHIWMESSIVSEYYVREKFNQLSRQFFQYGFWKNYVNKKHHTLITSRQLAPPFLVVFFALSFIFTLYLKTALLPILLSGYVTFFGGYSLLLNAFRPLPSFYTLVAFICMHISYGCGYLLGAFYAFVLQQKAPQFVQTITR